MPKHTANRINSFNHRCVRDLAWVIASPPLVSGCFERDSHHVQWWSYEQCQSEFSDCLPRLKQLDKNPQDLLDHLNTIKSKRLGLYFEGLIGFWISSISPNFKLLAQNIQLHEIAGDTRSRTIGEIDFIIRDTQRDKVIHLEVAVKFYLGTAPLADPYRWFGTNIQDQLGRKVDHLKHHQTQLSLQHTKQLPFSIDERQCFIKGRLFYPHSMQNVTDITIPHGVAHNHLRGYYYFYDECDEADPFCLSMALDKSQWLAELTSQDIAHLAEKKSLQSITKKNIAVEDRARCYALLRQNESGKYEETKRFFCLPPAFVFPEN